MYIGYFVGIGSKSIAEKKNVKRKARGRGYKTAKEISVNL